MRWLLRVGRHDEWLGAALIAVVLATPPVASAQAAAPFQLQWRAPDECLSQQAVEARIRDHLRGSQPAPGPLQAVAQITLQQGDGYQLSLRIESAAGSSQRSLHGQTCQPVADAAALLIALALDPDLQLNGAPVPSAVHEPAAPPSDESPLARPIAPAPEAPASPPLAPRDQPTNEPPRETATAALGVELALLADIGALPGAGVGASLSLSLTLDPALLLLGTEVLMPTRSNLPGPALATVDFTGIFAFARGCARLFQSGALSANPCVLVELGSLGAQTQRIEQPRSESVLWFGAGAGAMGMVELGQRLHVSLSLFALLPSQRWRFWVATAAGREDVHHVAPVLARFMIGLGGDFE